jgi:hypothetical protein
LVESLAFFCKYWNSTHDSRYSTSLYSKHLVFEVSSCLRTMSYSCRRAASGSIRDARLAGA